MDALAETQPESAHRATKETSQELRKGAMDGKRSLREIRPSVAEILA